MRLEHADREYPAVIAAAQHGGEVTDPRADVYEWLNGPLTVKPATPDEELRAALGV